ncbi:MAG: beta-propeller fold lactonase family protein [Candidatus Latescibacteria bacterium]|nr:beta-propeller fold lactonase family protein [Candidatus Latescibacterota bacterium]
MIQCVGIVVLWISACVTINSCTGSVQTRIAAQDDTFLSPIALVSDVEGKTLYIAEFTSKKVSVFDIKSGMVKKHISLPGKPSGMALSPNDSLLYVTDASYSGSVHIIDLHTEKIIGDIAVGHTPYSPVISPDGKMLYVCNRFDNNVSVIDITEKKEIDRIPMLREPIAADITPDGKYIFVANHLPSGRILYDYVSDGGIMMIGSFISGGYYNGKKVSYAAAGVVLVVDTSNNRLIELIPLLNGATGLRGICISPDGRYAYVTHILANYKLPTTQVERGSINANALSIIDVTRLKLLSTVLLDDVDLGAANPWDVACSSDGKYICITHTGTHEISVIDRMGLHNKLEEVANGETVHEVSSNTANIPNDLSFLNGLRRRFQLEGNGPRGMSIVGAKVYIAEYFSDSVGVIDLESGNNNNQRSIALCQKKQLSARRRGEMLFNDARLCFQQWQSCASCHPEGRMDALNWDLLNDGIGNPKKTKSLLLSHETPPVMITGIRPDAEKAVRSGIKYILFTEQPEEKAAAIDIYLRSLKPIRSPYLNKGKLSKAAKRGEKIFKKAGCAKCHPPLLYTDLKKYDVGTGSGIEKNCKFDTPSLIEVWRTAPYLYDGRAETMYEVLIDKGDKHGSTSKLNYQDLNDLIEFVFSL